MNKVLHFGMICLITFIGISCHNSTTSDQKENTSHQALPIYGVRSLDANNDTVYHTIKDFTFVNQDSQIVTRQDFQGHIYISDFFFTSCPTICPMMTQQMLRVHEAFKDNPEVLILSHSIDFRADSVSVLKDYANRLGVTSQKWHFVTGTREGIYDVAKHSYYISAMEDKAAPGGYLHNGKFVLVDKQGRIRGYYTGTEKEPVDRLISDIQLLLKEVQ